MPYYMGDFYGSAGGWRGDPGFWSWAKGIAGTALGLIPGGGAAAGIIRNIGGRGNVGGAISEAGAMSPSLAKIGAIMKRPGVGPLTLGGVAAGAAGLGAMAGAGGMALMAPGAAVPKGYHLCKGMRPGLKHPHPCKTGPFVRNRRMNVCNPRALRRAIRRTHGFAKLAMKAIHITHPKKKGRFGGFRKRRRK